MAGDATKANFYKEAFEREEDIMFYQSRNPVPATAASHIWAPSSSRYSNRPRGRKVTKVPNTVSEEFPLPAVKPAGGSSPVPAGGPQPGSKPPVVPPSARSQLSASASQAGLQTGRLSGPAPSARSGGPTPSARSGMSYGLGSGRSSSSSSIFTGRSVSSEIIAELRDRKQKLLDELQDLEELESEALALKSTRSGASRASLMSAGSSVVSSRK